MMSRITPEQWDKILRERKPLQLTPEQKKKAEELGKKMKSLSREEIQEMMRKSLEEANKTGEIFD